MRNGQIVAFALSTIFLGGCATQTSERSMSAPVSAVESAIPRESVAAERCAESYHMRSSRQGAFHRAVVC